MTTPTNIADTVRALFSDATLLVKQEIALAKAEAGEKLDQVQTGIISIVGALFLAFVALIVLVLALIGALAKLDFLDMTTASLLVGVILAVIAFIAFKAGQKQLTDLSPDRTINSVREDARTISRSA